MLLLEHQGDDLDHSPSGSFSPATSRSSSRRVPPRPAQGSTLGEEDNAGWTTQLAEGEDDILVLDMGLHGADRGIPGSSPSPPRAKVLKTPTFPASPLEGRKTVNDLEKSLERREHENLNLVRELEEERETAA
jgi:hypothetical protein